MTQVMRLRALVHVGGPVQRASRRVGPGTVLRTCAFAGDRPLRVGAGQVPVLLEFSHHAIVGVAKLEPPLLGAFYFSELALLGDPCHFAGLFPSVAFVKNEILAVGLCGTQQHERVPALRLEDLRAETLLRKALRFLRGHGWRS